MQTISQTLSEAIKILQNAHVDSPRLSAEILLAYAMNKERLHIIVYPEKELSEDENSRFAALIQRRSMGEPVAYLVGSKEFFGRDFIVNQATLIPRPETELLVESVLSIFSASTHIHFADFGTGSGCIAVTLAMERPNWHGIAVDFSTGALSIAVANAKKHHVEQQINFIHADFTSHIFAENSLDLIVGNPPYISSADYNMLSHEIRNFEPITALIPNGKNRHSKSGMEHEEAIIHTAQKSLRIGGMLFLEHGFDQRDSMEMLLKNNKWKNVSYHKDLSGKYRFISAVKAQ